MIPAQLTGRLGSGPAPLLDEEILAPQFAFEMTHLLPGYLQIEKVLVLEYRRLGLLQEAAADAIAGQLHRMGREELSPDPARNLSDPAFAIERRVALGLAETPAAWHADRSRNDLQATAQLMGVRPSVLGALDALLALAATAREAAGRMAAVPMPGYTQLQAAQTITPGFHLAALSDQLIAAAARLLRTYDELNLCPLGAGAMAGQELPFDRDLMAKRCGFAGQQPHALVSVASRSWALYLAAEISVLGVTLSRFTTDLMAWSGSDCGYLVLPDELAGISSAMPQKRNYPVLERIRGRTAHLSSAYQDVALTQRNTPYTNMVEVSKESTVAVYGVFDTLGSVLRLLTAVLANLDVDRERAAARCATEHLGGFTLANQLTLRHGVPWREAQVAAGTYITAALARGVPPGGSPELLAEVLAAAGFPQAEPPREATRLSADSAGLLAAKVTPGSARPDAVLALLARQAERAAVLEAESRIRTDALERARREVDALLGLGQPVRAL